MVTYNERDEKKFVNSDSLGLLIWTTTLTSKEIMVVERKAYLLPYRFESFYLSSVLRKKEKTVNKNRNRVRRRNDESGEKHTNNTTFLKWDHF